MNIQNAVDQGYIAVKEIPNKGICGLYKMAFTVGLFIGIGEMDYVGRYCYPDMEAALKALTEWNGEGDPPGEWIKYKGYGGERRRVPDPYDEYHPDFAII